MLRALRFGNARPPPFPLMQFLGNGQSLSIGQNATTSPDSVAPYPDVYMLHDSSGTYATGSPTAGTLSLVPLAYPMRSGTPGNQYPTNLGGEDVTMAMVLQIRAIMAARGYSGFPLMATSAGQGGAAMSVIKKGGTGNAYAADIYEALAAQHIKSPSQVAIGGISWEHGEADSLNQYAGYQTDIVAQQLAFETDLFAAGFVSALSSGRIPLIASQQSTEPTSMTYPDVVNAQLVAAADANPTRIYVQGPRYQYSYNANDVHLSTYLPLGEKKAQIWVRLFDGLGWSPTRRLSTTRVGTVVTMTYNVPVGALVFDGGTGPHGAATRWNMWTAGKGFEPHDRPLTISSVTNASPSVVGFTTAHNLSTGEQIACFNVGGRVDLDTVWTVTVVDSTHVSLNGSTAGGTYTAGGTAFSPIGVTSASIAGNTVTVNLARTPIGTGAMDYAMQCDSAAQNAGGGLANGGRFGLLRDSDGFRGRSGAANYNWAIHETSAF